MTLQIKEHGIYERRDGVIVAWEETDQFDRTVPLKVGGRWYQRDGELFLDQISSLDLIREIVVGPGWMPHNGGENPAPGKVVECMFRGGTQSVVQESSYWGWRHLGDGGDILAYRIVEEAAKPANEHTTKETAMTPLHMMILIECQSCGDGQNMKWDIWVSEAGKAAKKALREDGLIDGTARITDKGRVWLERALATPMPVQKWVFEGE